MACPSRSKEFDLRSNVFFHARVRIPPPPNNDLLAQSVERVPFKIPASFNFFPRSEKFKVKHVVVGSSPTQVVDASLAQLVRARSL